MLHYVLRRFLTAIPTLFVIITISFFLMRVAPGGPFNQEKGLNPVIKANLERVYHLDDPLWMQYLRYLGNLLQGDLGPTYTSPDFTVADRFAAGLPVSIQLGGTALVLALLVGGVLGIAAALHQNKWEDYSVIALATAGSTIPTFVIAPLFQLFFALTLKWFPVGGWGDGALVNKVGPVITLMLPQVAIVARLMRGSMIESLHSHHIRTAQGPWPFRLCHHYPPRAPWRPFADCLLCGTGRRCLADGLGDRRVNLPNPGDWPRVCVRRPEPRLHHGHGHRRGDRAFHHHLQSHRRHSLRRRRSAGALWLMSQAPL